VDVLKTKSLTYIYHGIAIKIFKYWNRLAKRDQMFCATT